MVSHRGSEIRHFLKGRKGKFATLPEQMALTRKESFLFFPPRWCGKWCSGAFVGGREPNIASGSERIQVLKSAHQGGRRGVHGNVGIPSTPS